MKVEPDVWSWVKMGFAEWRSAVDSRMRDIFMITIEDSGIDDKYLKSHWQMKQSPYEFVEWFGIKFDLTSRDQVEWDQFKVA